MKSTVTIKDIPVKGSESGIKKKKLRNMGSLSIDETQLPDIKNWQVGEEYEVVVKIRQTGVREVDNWEIDEYGIPKGSIKAEFEIMKVSSKNDTK